MVKRLRRRPLTAESGVRVPLGVPIKSPNGLFSFHKGTYKLRLFDCRQSNPLVAKPPRGCGKYAVAK